MSKLGKGIVISISLTREALDQLTRAWEKSPLVFDSIGAQRRPSRSAIVNQAVMIGCKVLLGEGTLTTFDVSDEPDALVPPAAPIVQRRTREDAARFEVDRQLREVNRLEGFVKARRLDIEAAPLLTPVMQLRLERLESMFFHAKERLAAALAVLRAIRGDEMIGDTPPVSDPTPIVMPPMIVTRTVLDVGTGFDASSPAVLPWEAKP